MQRWLSRVDAVVGKRSAENVHRQISPVKQEQFVQLAYSSMLLSIGDRLSGTVYHMILLTSITVFFGPYHGLRALRLFLQTPPLPTPSAILTAVHTAQPSAGMPSCHSHTRGSCVR